MTIISNADDPNISESKCELCNCWCDAIIDGHKLCSGHYPWYDILYNWLDDPQPEWILEMKKKYYKKG